MITGSNKTVRYYVKDAETGWSRGPFPRERLQEKADKLRADRLSYGGDPRIVYIRETTLVVRSETASLGEF